MFFAMSHSTWDLVVWLLGGTTVWLVASIPAYWFFSGWAYACRALSGTFQSLVLSTAAARACRRSAEVAFRATLADRSRLAADGAADAAWERSLATTLKAVCEGSRQIGLTRVVAQRAARQIEDTARRVRNLRLPSAVVPMLPEADALVRQGRRNRSAVVNAVLAIVLLVPIVLTNAQLTGLVLGEQLPPVQPMMGLPVPYVFAMVLVIAEITIGLLHSAAAETGADSGRRFTVATFVWSIFAMVVVAIETVIYAQVESATAALRLPGGVSAFALVGALLGASVFGLGRLAHSSVMTVRKDQTPRVLARQLRGLSAAAEDWNAVAGKLKPAQHECANTFGLLVDLCAQVSAAQSLSVQQLTNQAEAMRASPPSWVSPRRMEAVVALCRLSSMWLAHRLTGAALAIAVGLFWVIQAGASVIEYGARLVAWPAIAIFEALRSRRQEPAAMGAVS